MKRALAGLAAFGALAAAAFAGRSSSADDPQQAAPAPAASASPTQPDESLLGTVEVNGSAGLPPLPKLAVVPIVSTGTADSIVVLVVRRDMELSGQFDVMDEGTSPPGPFLHATPLDLGAWRAQGAEYVLRVFAEPAPNDSIKTQLVGEAYVTPTRAPSAPTVEARPAFRVAMATVTTEVRAASHRLVDLLLGALTGRPGGFASEMVYAQKVGRWRRVFAIDSDGFDLRPIGPSDATAVSPAFGPNDQVFYALSRDYSPFRLAFGPNATPVPLAIPGSILGVAFSADHARMALTVMTEGRSELWIGARGALEQAGAKPFANHPVFGPLGKMAYVAGTPMQRVYLGETPISPPGFMASAPVFCDTPQGLLVIYTVGVGSGADIVASDSNGGNVRRLTQHEGANTYAACSPDGRLVSFFSTGKVKRGSGGQDEGSGLFIMPIARPWLAKKISSEVGEALRWEALPAAGGIVER
ncbi:MAG TPA: tolB protein [Polyangiaceae bacterium]|nr:tolB protein [Polyangiaceae bacterium]